jgi:hypothetical protein
MRIATVREYEGMEEIWQNLWKSYVVGTISTMPMQTI